MLIIQSLRDRTVNVESLPHSRTQGTVFDDAFYGDCRFSLIHGSTGQAGSQRRLLTWNRETPKISGMISDACSLYGHFSRALKQLNNGAISRHRRPQPKYKAKYDTR